MDHKKFYFVNKPFYFLFIVLLITSCGSYQYSGYINDGIYQNNDISKDYAFVENQEINDKANNDYYKSAFSEKALMYSESETDDQLFTDVENYRTNENDSINNNYGPWGEYKDSIVVNVHSHHHDGFWSRWRYPNWMWNYGYGYGSLNTWGYGYNNYWSRPFPFYGGMYDPFNPFWGYYDSFFFGYGYGYAYGYPYGYYSWWRPYNSWYNNNSYGRFNTNVSFVSGRRNSRNIISSRSNNLINTNIRDRFNRSNSNSLSDRLSRIDRVNNSARINPNLYNKPLNSAGSSNSLSKPRGNYTRPSNNNSGSNYSKPSNNNYKPSGSTSRGNFSRPSYSPSSSSSFSRGGGRVSSGASSSRGGKSGR
tara:strand:- start:275 stop:1366 length:1092 start_codon:yes stop_codon:yes gene_type:complete